MKSFANIFVMVALVAWTSDIASATPILAIPGNGQTLQKRIPISASTWKSEEDTSAFMIPRSLPDFMQAVSSEVENDKNLTKGPAVTFAEDHFMGKTGELEESVQHDLGNTFQG